MPRPRLHAVALVVLAACATVRQADVRHAPTHAPASAALTAEQLEAAAPGSSLLDALRRLRPELLQARAPSLRAPGGTSPAVYLDGAPHAELSVLASIPTRMVARVQFLRPSETGARLGRDYAGGAIVITTRSAP